MFTGLVEELGAVAAVDRTDDGVRLSIRGELAHELRAGDSVSVNGVCLTAAAVNGGSFCADVMHRTLSSSSLEALQPGSMVNLELPLRASDRLGGHVVQGHVDGVGTVTDVREDGFSRLVTIAADAELLRYAVPKGSIAVDGISLTVADLGEDAFSVSLIPETLRRTSLGSAERGTRVNLEVDVLAKYVERLVSR